MRKLALLAIAGLVRSAVAVGEPCDFVNVFIGTDANGHTTPAASRPFGFVQAGPDTGNGDWAHCSGYRFGDPEIFGFSQTHLSGTGCIDLGDVRLFPHTGAWTNGEWRSTYRKATEKASPGSYEVTLDAGSIAVDLTATERVACHRYVWPADATDRRMLVDFQWGLVDDRSYFTRVLACDIRTTKNGFEGTVTSKRWATRTLHFVLAFDRAPAAVTRLAPRDAREKGPRYEVHFDGSGELKAKVALSYTSLDGARANLAAEVPGWDFASVRAAARAAWNDLLSRATVAGGTSDERTVFMTSLYHAFYHPTVASDAGAEPLYSQLSTWDTYRAAHPLYTLLSPERVDGFVNTCLWHFDRRGYLPKWPLGQDDTQCMVGNHAVPIIVDAWLKGFRGFDAGRAWKAIDGTLRAPHKGKKLEDWAALDRYGYYPFDVVRENLTVSRTLEDAYDDWCAHLFAKALGRAEDAAFYLNRSQAWKRIFDAETGFMRGRDSKGAFRSPFDPAQVRDWCDRKNDYVEANAWQYLWHVQQDPNGLAALLGGRDAFAAKLDAFFSAPPPDNSACDDVSGFVGQYAHGNEPSHHVCYFYQFAGRGDRTAERVSEVCRRYYTNAPDGLCGNEDCGQMSAWYVFSAAGFYPVDPCGGDYVLGVPQFSEVTLKLPDGKTFRVIAKGGTDARRRVKGVKLNGRPLDGFILRHADIVAGGELVFELD